MNCCPEALSRTYWPCLHTYRRRKNAELSVLGVATRLYSENTLVLGSAWFFTVIAKQLVPIWGDEGREGMGCWQTFPELPTLPWVRLVWLGVGVRVGTWRPIAWSTGCQDILLHSANYLSGRHRLGTCCVLDLEREIFWKEDENFSDRSVRATGNPHAWGWHRGLIATLTRSMTWSPGSFHWPQWVALLLENIAQPVVWEKLPWRVNQNSKCRKGWEFRTFKNPEIASGAWDLKHVLMHRSTVYLQTDLSKRVETVTAQATVG